MRIFPYVLLVITLTLFPDWVQGQESSYKLQLKDTSTYNSSTGTIDLYAVLLEDGQLPEKVDFNEFKAWEKFANGDSQALPILSINLESDAISGQEKWYKILTQSDKKLHRESRTYVLQWVREDQLLDDSFITRNYSDTNAFNLGGNSSIPLIIVVGLLFLATLLLLLSESIPLLKKIGFERKYVRQLFDVLPAGETKLHPVTGRPIPPNTLVVQRCGREECMVPLALWKENGYQCFHAPRLCTGAANLGFQKFFEQTGVFRSLNWLWFGAVGGFLGWMLSYASKAAFLTNPFAQSWSVALITGAFLGLGLALMLALVEELGSSRGFDWGNLLIRTGLGAVAGGAVFTAGFFLAEAMAAPLAGTIITWFLFCIAIGAVLSINSFIMLKRAIVSSLVAGAVSTLIYGLMIYLFQEAEMARMLSFVLLGAILGWGILQVVNRLEQMELMVVSPSSFNEMVYNIDRMVANGNKALIGRIKGKSDIYIKWDDRKAQDRHAELYLSNEKLFIQPLQSAEIWVNHKPVSEPYALSAGDVIKLGRDSMTTFMFKAKQGAQTG